MCALVQPRDDRGVNVLGDHDVVAQVESGRIDAPSEQFQRLRKIGAVVGYRAAIGDIHSHAMTTPGAACSLPVVGGQRRYVAH